MFFFLFIGAFLSLSDDENITSEISSDTPIDPTRTPYATLVSKKPTLAIALSTCIACIIAMIIATSIKCIMKPPDEDFNGMQEKLLMTNNDIA